MSKGNWSALGQAKLESSGLTTDLGAKLGMYEVPSAMQMHESFEARPSIVIPYFDINGKAIRKPAANGEFYRLRYLGKAAPTFATAAGEKEIRYVQPPGSGVSAYFPRLTNWGELQKDVSKPLFITEGELKAAAGTLAGFATIGLGGVWNFRAAADGWFFLPELEVFDWRQRDVYVVFDSDYVDNKNICAAINRLGEELVERGAIVRVITLPALEEGQKTGLDDFFLAKNNDDFEQLMKEAELLGFTRTLWRMNDEVLYVKDPGLMVVQETGMKMSPDAFRSHSEWSTLSTPIRHMSSEGVIVLKKVSAAPAWLQWPLRRSVKAITYAPGQPRITEDNEFNGWKGWGVVPKKGNVEPWQYLCKWLFADMEKGALDYFYDWCAYPLQNPGAKMFVSTVIHGLTQGTGKSLIGYTLGEIYGENFKELTKDEDLEETFWAENRQFVMGDEVTGNDNRKHANKLKRMITQRKLTINVKYVPQFDIPDRINYFFTAQHADAFFLEDKDRRFFIVECTAEEPLPDQFYKDYDDWLWRKGGPSALFHWLLERKISKNFNPFAPAFRTAAKERMIMNTKGELASWLFELNRFPDDYLRLGAMVYTKDLFSAQELLTLYEAHHANSKVTGVGMGRAISSSGIPMMAGGQPLRGPDGKQSRYYAVRNISYWRTIKDRKIMERNLLMQPTRLTKEGKQK